MGFFDKLFGEVDPNPRGRLLDTIRIEMNKQAKQLKDDDNITAVLLFERVMTKKYFALSCARYDITHEEVREMAKEIAKEYCIQ